MKKITREEVNRIALMSDLALSVEEETVLLKELQQVLDYIDFIDSVSVADTLRTNKAINVFREDKVLPGESSTILKNAQASSDDYFVVPKILKQ